MPPQKKYICAFCARAFSRSEHKQRHERSHTNEKPFHCQYCTSAFVRRDLLQRHCRTVHNINVVPLASKVSKKNNSLPSSPIEYEESPLAPVEQLHKSMYTHRKNSQNLPQSIEQDLNLNNFSPNMEDDHDTAMGSSTDSPGTTRTTKTIVEKKIVQSLSLCNKLNVVFSNFQKVSILQTKDSPQIQNIMADFEATLPFDVKLVQNIEDYFLAWNIHKSNYPLLDALENEAEEFIEYFSNSSSLTMISKLFSKFNGQGINMTCSNSQKILLIECKVCLLYSILALGAANYNNNDDCIILFMKAWNLLISNLIPRLNSNSENFETRNPNTNDVTNDQMMILKNLFMLAYVSSQISLKIRHSVCTSNVVNSDIVFNYLDDISYIIVSHLDEVYGSCNSIKSSKQSRNSSSTSLDSQMSENGNISADLPVVDENMQLFWSIYVILSKFFMIRSHGPPKIYSYLLKSPISKGMSLIKVVESLATKQISSLTPFQNEIIVFTLSNELQSQIHYNKMFIYKLKSTLHNAIIFLNQSLNDDHENGSFIHKIFKKKMSINCPQKFRSLLTDYMFIPEESYNWDLLYLSLKEYNFKNYDTNANLDSNASVLDKNFKFHDFFKVFFEDFESHPETETDNNDQYMQFIKVIILFFSNKKGLTLFDISNPVLSDSDKNQMINNNIGISSIPILFSFQCLQVDLLDLKCREGFELKIYHYMLLEWYLTMVKLVIGLKYDSCLYNNQIDPTPSPGKDVHVKTHHRSRLNESVHDLNMNQATILSPQRKNTEEFNLANNYIFQCFIFMLQQLGSTYRLPSGELRSLSDFQQELNFETDTFRVSDIMIYLLLKNIDSVLYKCIEKINEEGSDVINSSGFNHLKRFMDSYVYSQLDIPQKTEDGSTYPSRNNQVAFNMASPFAPTKNSTSSNGISTSEKRSSYNISHRHLVNVASIESDFGSTANNVTLFKNENSSTDLNYQHFHHKTQFSVAGQLLFSTQQDQRHAQPVFTLLNASIILPPILPPLGAISPPMENPGRTISR